MDVCECERTALRVGHECEGLSERYNVTNVTIHDVSGPSAAVFQQLVCVFCDHRAMLLVLCSGKQNSEFEGSSQSLDSPVSSAASGFLLMTKSRLSPASIIRGTVRQQSKSLVLTWFTWKIKTIWHVATFKYCCSLLYWRDFNYISTVNAVITMNTIMKMKLKTNKS